MPSSEKQDAAEELAKLLAESATATALWPTEADRRVVAERVAERYRPDPERGKWRVQAFAHDPTSTKLFVVKRAEHDVYSDPLKAKAKAVANALNALEERR